WSVIGVKAVTTANSAASPKARASDLSSGRAALTRPGSQRRRARSPRATCSWGVPSLPAMWAWYGPGLRFRRPVRSFGTFVAATANREVVVDGTGNVIVVIGSLLPARTWQACAPAPAG